jgi:hypothetical protein
MATLDFKGKALVQNYHLSVKYHELVPKRDRSLTDKVRLDDNRRKELPLAQERHRRGVAEFLPENPDRRRQDIAGGAHG